MSFREKSAWISAVVHVAVFAGYFLSLAHAWDQPGGRRPMGVGLMIAAVIVLVANITVLTILLALTSLREASRPADEREQLIELKGRAAGFPQRGEGEQDGEHGNVGDEHDHRPDHQAHAEGSASARLVPRIRERPEIAPQMTRGRRGKSRRFSHGTTLARPFCLVCWTQCKIYQT